MGIPGIEEYDINLSIPQPRIDDLVSVQPDDVEPANELSFARNVFIPLTTACRYTCTYCTYFDPPGQASLLSPEEIQDIVQKGVNTGCTEALFTFGDDPDDRYTAIYDQLHDFGHDSIHSYLREACEIALEAGLLPHSNPGDQTYKQMQMVADVNASMGVMLETTADVAAHSGPRVKNPGQRLHTLKVAGELHIPFTTGILVGIGEAWEDRAESLLAIKEMHERYGHIQEVIIQNVVPNDRWDGDTPSTTTMRKTVAMARSALPGEVSVQVPPNLSPVKELLDCGVDDLGGVSPVTDDHINPDYAWPAIEELQTIANEAGVPLIERLPVYERYLPNDQSSNKWVSEEIMDVIGDDSEIGSRYQKVRSQEPVIEGT